MPTCSKFDVDFRKGAENCYGLMHSFLSDRHQRVVLNGQSSKWSHIKAEVPQGSILRPLLILVYINDLSEGLTTSAKLLQVISHFFSVVHDSAASAAFLDDDLLKISRWAYQWKMIFNPDAPKQTQEIVISRKANASNHTNIQRHLGLFLDFKLSFFDHINKKLKRLLKGSML